MKRVLLRLPPAAIVILAPWLSGAGCGANLQALYEGDRHFERCMALDARTDVAVESKRGCWVAWVERSSFGQTRDRLTHAEARIDALSTTEQAGGLRGIVAR
jgi:hypothetical protein